jgi:hypothetical protein
MGTSSTIYPRAAMLDSSVLYGFTNPEPDTLLALFSGEGLGAAWSTIASTDVVHRVSDGGPYEVAGLLHAGLWTVIVYSLPPQPVTLSGEAAEPFCVYPPCWAAMDYSVNQAIDLDDFFLFADHFGLDAGSEGWDGAYDLTADGIVDWDDFFRFMDAYRLGWSDTWYHAHYW